MGHGCVPLETLQSTNLSDLASALRLLHPSPLTPHPSAAPPLLACPRMQQVADFAAALSAREVLFWRIFFEHLLASCKTSADAAAFFKRWVR